eukprot:PhF_6_TR6313/c0_g1_i2/m.9569
MGSVHSNVLQHIETQFLEVQNIRDGGTPRRNISLSALREMTQLELYPLNTNHFPTLYMLDANKDGQFAMDDLNSFANWCAKVIPNHDTVGRDFMEKVQAYAMVALCKDCRKDGGIKRVTEWMCSLVITVYPGRMGQLPNPHAHHCKVDDLEPLDDVRSVHTSYSANSDLSANSTDEDELEGLERGMHYEEIHLQFMDTRAVVLLFKLINYNEVYDLDQKTFLESLFDADRDKAPEGTRLLTPRRVKAEDDQDEILSSEVEGNFVTHITVEAVVSVFLQSMMESIRMMGFDGLGANT